MVSQPKQRPKGRNIFLVYIPPDNAEAVVHYEDTIRKKVAPERIYQYVPDNLRTTLQNIFKDRPIAVWGSREGKANRARFERMRPGDDVLIIEGSTIKLLGKIAAITINADLSNELWKPVGKKHSEPWNLIYFIANPQEIDVPFSNFRKLMGYKKDYQLRGFSTVSEERLESFYSRYDDLYSILTRIKQGAPIQELPNRDLYGRPFMEAQEQPTPTEREDLEKDLPDEKVSDHLRMQWMLLNLGRKAGSRVWIPANDQGRIRDQYHFNDFETDFTAGLDAQTRYVENIDVVWKEEFRIDAAFEIENSTAIYSGLLRFSDLTLVAPNTIYPLFIVAPPDKRNRLIEQLRRPTFHKLHLDRKVRYLSYEAVEKIDKDYQNRERGLTLEYIVDSSEEIQLHH